MTEAEMAELKASVLPVLHRTNALVLDLYELLGSWSRVELWFADAVAEAEQKSYEALFLDPADEADWLPELECARRAFDD